MRLMLPASNVRGHKEWAPGRKSDPTYSMDWRRDRVARFTPNTETVLPPQPPVEEFLMALSDTQQSGLLQKVNELHETLVDGLHKRIDDPKDAKPTWVAMTFLRAAEGNARRAVAELAGLRAAFSEVAKAIAAGTDVDPAAIEAAAERGTRKALAEGTVQVDVSVAGQQPPA